MRGSMASYVIRRLGFSALLLFLVLSLTFFFVRLAPGDPTLLIDNPQISTQHRESLRKLWGLDQPVLAQYFSWMRSVVLERNWGVSYVHARPVGAVIRERVPATLLLASIALGAQYLAGLGLGVFAARRSGTQSDHWLRFLSLLLYALPVFWTGLMTLSIFSFKLGWLPGGHLQSADAQFYSPFSQLLDIGRHLVLPSLVLAAATAGATARFARNSLLEELRQDYVRTARAKGLSENRVVWIHALRNAATPLVQLIGLSLPFLLSGSLIVEVVFSWPGMGSLAYHSVMARDYPVVLAVTALSGVLVVGGNLLADLLQAGLDPRVRQ